MIKGALVLGIAILCMGFGVWAGDVPSGSADYGVGFGYTAPCLALKFWDADVGVEFIYNGVREDSVFQARGDGVTYSVPCDSINIIRGTATGGVYILGSPSGRVCPSFASSDILRGAVDSDGLKISPDLVTTLTSLADTLARSDTLDIDGGDISDYKEIYIKLSADTFASDSLDIYFGSSENGSWDSGNTTYFDRDPETAGIQGWCLDGLGTYGIIISVVDKYGAFVVGDHLLIKIINSNLGIGSTGSESGCSRISSWIIKRR